MYAVICSAAHIDEIETAVNSIEDTLIYRSVGGDLSGRSEFAKVRSVSFKHLIVDTSCFDAATNLLNCLKQLRLQKDDVQIIVYAHGYKAGDPFLAGLVQLGIYNILLPADEDFILLPALLDLLNKPMTYSKAIRYVDINSNPDFSDDSDDQVKTQKEPRAGKEIIEKTIEIEKEKLIGPVIIGVAGALKRIGTTHTVLALSTYLSSSYRVAVVEYCSDSPIFLSILNSYDVSMDRDKSFSFNNVRYFPYSKDFNIASLMKYDFDYIIFDLGVYESCDKKEFWRSQLRLLLCGSQMWELSPLEIFFKETDRKDIVCYLFNFTDDITFKEISKSLSPLKCYQVPYNPHIYDLNESQKFLYSSLLDDYIPKEKSRNKRRFFGMFY